MLSEGSDQTTDVQAQSVQADSTLRTSYYRFYHAQTHARFVSANHNA